jgi:hypothetical protein
MVYHSRDIRLQGRRGSHLGAISPPEVVLASNIMSGSSTLGSRAGLPGNARNTHYS